jgi:hypothetical protein
MLRRLLRSCGRDLERGAGQNVVAVAFNKLSDFWFVNIKQGRCHVRMVFAADRTA